MHGLRPGAHHPLASNARRRLPQPRQSPPRGPARAAGRWLYSV